MAGDLYRISNDMLEVEVSPHGAELYSLYDKQQKVQLLWQGDAQYWPRRAPILFPIVGKLKSDTLVHKGISYPCRTSRFDMATSC